LSEASTLVPFCQLFDPSCEPGERLRSNLPSAGRFPPGATKPQEGSVLGSVDGALIPIHLELEALHDEASDPRHHPHPGSSTAHIDVAVIAVATEPEASGFKFLVQFIQHYIGQERRKGRALRCTFRWDGDQTVFENACLQIGAEELQDSLVRDLLGEAAHEPVVTDAIKEFLQIDIHHVAVALLQLGLGLAHRLMSAAPWTKAIARVRKC
jgi:hypothetical protein